MKKYLSILLLLAPLFVFGQTKIKFGQIQNATSSKVIVSNSSGTLNSDSLDWYSTTKTLSNGVLSTDHSADSIAFLGNSVTFGSNTSGVFYRFSKLTADGLGYKELNFGVPGTTAANWVANSGGAFSIYGPGKSSSYSHRKILFIELGYNDITALVTDTTTFHANMNSLYSKLVTNGFTGANMVYLSINGASYGRANSVNFNTVISQVAAAHGSKYIDVYSYGNLSIYGVNTTVGKTLITNDNIHPNNRGSFITSKVVLAAMNTPNYNFASTTPSSAFQSAEIQTIKIKNPLVSTQRTQLAALDSAGNLRITFSLPDSTSANGKLFLGNSAIQSGANTPASMTSNDFYVTPNARFIYYGNNGPIAYYLPATSSSANSVLSNNWAGITINTGSSGTISNVYTFDTTGGFGMQQASTLYNNYGAGINSLMLCSASTGHTIFSNTAQNASYQFKVSGGAGFGSSSQAIVFNQFGRAIFSSLAANTFTDVPSAQIVINSTTTGFLQPRMTTTQQNAISSPAEGLNIYDNVLHVPAFYNGTVWKNYATTTQAIAGHTIFTPTTGGTVSLVNNQTNIINPAGSLVALTVNLPSSPANDDKVVIKYTQAVTTVTYGNGTVVDGITAPTAGGLVVLTYDSGTTSWY